MIVLSRYLFSRIGFGIFLFRIFVFRASLILCFFKIAVDIAAMRYSVYPDPFLSVIHCIKDSILALSDTVSRMPRDLLGTGGSGFFLQVIQNGNDEPLDVFWQIQQLPSCVRLQLQPVRQGLGPSLQALFHFIPRMKTGGALDGRFQILCVQ